MSNYAVKQDQNRTHQASKTKVMINTRSLQHTHASRGSSEIKMSKHMHTHIQIPYILCNGPTKLTVSHCSKDREHIIMTSTNAQLEDRRNIELLV